MCACVCVCVTVSVCVHVCVCVCVSCTGKGAEIRKLLPELPSPSNCQTLLRIFFWTRTSDTLKLSICYKMIVVKESCKEKRSFIHALNWVKAAGGRLLCIT